MVKFIGSVQRLLMLAALGLFTGTAVKAETTRSKSSRVTSKKSSVSPRPSPKPAPKKVAPKTASLSPNDLADFAQNPPSVRNLLAVCLDLSSRQLAYQFGSADPQQGGMDCSGTIYFVLRERGVKNVPRDAFGQYQWVWESATFRAVHGKKEDSFELSALRPGDLLFWSGTYSTKGRDPAVSHVMIYLGKTKEGGRPVMFGASEGRPYLGTPRYGVSVFDFRLPAASSSSRFLGYAPVPGLR